MADTLKHKKVSAKADDPDTTLVRPSDWNETHGFAGGFDGDILTRLTSASAGFEWTTPDVVLDPFASASLPVAGTTGRLIRLSDLYRGILMDQGTQWFSINGQVCNVKEFGAVGDGVADDTVKIQAALDAGAAITFFPAGVYKITAVLTITNGTRLLGAGMPSIAALEAGSPKGTTISLATAGQIGISVDSSHPVDIRDMAIRNGTTMTSNNSAITITGPSGGLVGNQSALLHRVLIYGCYTGVTSIKTVFFQIDDCVFWNNTHDSIRIDNTGDNDQGDSLITDSVFLGDTINAVGLRWKSSGGLTVRGNKFLGFVYPIVCDRVGSANTTNFFVIDNSIENFLTAGMFFQRTAGALDMGQILIRGNELSSTADYSIQIAPGAPAFTVFVITDNLLMNSGVACIKASDVNGMMISGNTLNGSGVALDFASSVVNTTIGPNVLYGLNPFAGNMSGVILNLPFTVTFGQLGAIAFQNSSLVFVSDGTVANPLGGGGNGSLAKRVLGGWIGI